MYSPRVSCFSSGPRAIHRSLPRTNAAAAFCSVPYSARIGAGKHEHNKAKTITAITWFFMPPNSSSGIRYPVRLSFPVMTKL